MTFEIPGDEDYDPCTTYIELRQAYLAVLKGETVQRVRFKNGEEERETDFSSANVNDLRAAMAQAKAECMEKTTGRPGRSAIGIGFARPRPRSFY